MPGLQVVISRDASSQGAARRAQAVDALRRDEHCRAQEWTHDGFCVTQIIRSPLGHSFCEDDALAVWVYGAVYPEHSACGQAWDESGSAAYVAERYRALGARAVEQLNGEFNLVVWEKAAGTLLVANDRFGLRPWYYTRRGDAAVLSPGIRGLLPYLSGGPRLDEVAAATVLVFNKIRLGDRTLFEDIQVLAAASVWRVELSSGRVDERQYWEFRYNDALGEGAPDARTLDRLVERFRAAVACRGAVRVDRRVGIALSGGLDSRAVAAGLSAEGQRAVSAHTCGLLDSDEVRLAQQAAQTAGLRHHLYELGATDFLAHAHSFMDVWCDDFDIFVQGGHLAWLPQAQHDVDVIITGMDLDVTLGGCYLTPEVLRAQNDGHVLDLLKQTNSAFQPSHWPEFLGTDAWRRRCQAVYTLALDLIAGLPQESAAAKYDLFLYLFSARRVIRERYALYRAWLDTASAIHDHEFLDLVLAMPVMQRAYYATYLPFLARLSPSLAAIPYQRTMLPATTPWRFWDSAFDVERQREQLYTDIWRDTGGEVFIPYRRYYSNFDEWLRMDRGWIEFADGLLRQPNAALYQLDMVRPAYVAEMIDQHRGARRNHRARLIVLMSLELYLEKFFA